MPSEVIEKLIYFFSDALRIITVCVYATVIFLLYIYIEFTTTFDYSHHWIDLIRNVDTVCIAISSITLAAIFAIFFIKFYGKTTKLGVKLVGIFAIISLLTSLFSIFFSYIKNDYSASKFLFFFSLAFSVAEICGLFILLNWNYLDTDRMEVSTSALVPPTRQTTNTSGVRETFGEFFVKIGFIIFIVVYIIWFLLTMYQHSTDSQYVTTAILAIPSFFVAVVTFLYVLLTRDLVKANQDIVKGQSRPKFSLDYREVKMDTYQDKFIFLKNSGEVARNLTISFTPNWEGFAKPAINIMAIGHNEKTNVLQNFNEINQPGHIIIVTLDYENIFSDKCKEELKISFENLHNLGYIDHQ
jgi:hypothetical protein